MKIVINSCYGGFSLSEAGIFRYAELKGITLYPTKDNFFTVYWTTPPEQRLPELSSGDFSKLSLEEKKAHNDQYREQTLWIREFERNDPILIQVVEELGDEANGRRAELKVVEIPDDVKWEIQEYDGIEWVAEEHRTWS